MPSSLKSGYIEASQRLVVKTCDVSGAYLQVKKAGQMVHMSLDRGSAAISANMSRNKGVLFVKIGLYALSWTKRCMFVSSLQNFGKKKSHDYLGKNWASHLIPKILRC